MICTAHERGRGHGFRIFKRSQVRFGEVTECLGMCGLIARIYNFELKE
jgi:hypothetical protein